MVNIQSIARDYSIEDYTDEVTIRCRNVVRDRESVNFGRHELTDMSCVCDHCGASYYKDEGRTFCCGGGKIVLPFYSAML